MFVRFCTLILFCTMQFQCCRADKVLGIAFLTWTNDLLHQGWGWRSPSPRIVSRRMSEQASCPTLTSGVGVNFGVRVAKECPRGWRLLSHWLHALPEFRPRRTWLEESWIVGLDWKTIARRMPTDVGTLVRIVGWPNKNSDRHEDPSPGRKFCSWRTSQIAAGSRT